MVPIYKNGSNVPVVCSLIPVVAPVNAKWLNVTTLRFLMELQRFKQQVPATDQVLRLLRLSTVATNRPGNWLSKRVGSSGMNGALQMISGGALEVACI